MIYPWQQTQWQHVNTLLQTARLPHALLLTGEKGLGKLAFAQAFAQHLLCVAGREVACSHNQACQCQACQWVSKGMHPDLQQIISETDTIKVDMIRELMPFLQNCSHAGGKKIVIISPVEQMNVAAANALLKALEEPTNDTHFILTSHNISLVPATVKSRCQRVAFTAQPPQIHTWLRAQGYAKADIEQVLSLAPSQPLIAQQWLTQPTRLTAFQAIAADMAMLAQSHMAYSLEVSKRWQEFESIELLAMILQVLIIGLVSGANISIDQSLIKAMQQNPREWLNLYQSLLEIRRSLIQGYNLSKAIVVDKLMASLVRMAS